MSRPHSFGPEVMARRPAPSLAKRSGPHDDGSHPLGEETKPANPPLPDARGEFARLKPHCRGSGGPALLG
eukprot:6836961-Alexandrium_andersonii.AAC.1